MGNLFSALNISASALKVHKSGISIISNNIANMNTEGYSKQKANLGTLVVSSSITNANSQVNSSIGVELINVSRYTPTFSESYYMSQVSEQSNLDKQLENVSNLAEIFDELKGQGLDNELEEFYASLDNLNKYPSDKTSRINFIDKASALTDKLNKLSSDLTKLENMSVGDGVSQKTLEQSDIGKSIKYLNQNLSELAKINKMLMLSQLGTLENNNLLDKRNQLLKEISKYGNFEQSINSNGSVNLSLDGIKILQGAVVQGEFTLETATQYGEYCRNNGIENKNDCNAVVSFNKIDGKIIHNINSKFTSGEIGGILSSNTGYNDTNTKTILSGLDKLAFSISNVFNAIQTQKGAYYLENKDGTIQLSDTNLENYEIFTTKDGSDTITAKNITVNSLLKDSDGYNKIATAYFADNNPDINALVNSSNVIMMIKTKNDTMSSGFDSIGNISFSEYYNGIIGEISSSVETKENLSLSQNSLVQSLDNKIKEQTGVDLNEELADMVRFQTAFSASARVFDTCNSLLDTLIHLGE